jgi:hypothetical protein
LHNLQSAAAIDNNKYNKTRERERERERESKCKLQSSRVYEKIAKEEHIP